MNQPDNTRAAETDLQQLETRLDGRLQALSARFIGVDGRFATLGDRITDIGQIAALDRSTAACRDKIDRVIDQAQAQLDQAQTDLAGIVARAHNDLRRIVILGLLGTVLGVGLVCVTTIVLTL